MSLLEQAGASDKVLEFTVDYFKRVLANRPQLDDEIVNGGYVHQILKFKIVDLKTLALLRKHRCMYVNKLIIIFLLKSNLFHFFFRMT